MSAGTAPAETLPRYGFYFGWRVVFAMMLATATVYGTLIFSFIILGGPLARQYGWSSAETGSLVSAMWIVAPVALFVAPFIQRFGALRILMLGLGLQAVSFAMLGLIDNFWQLYLLRVVMGLGKVMAVVCVPVMVTAWFTRRFATAMALAWCGGSLGGFVLSPLTERMLVFLSWRQSALVLAGLMVAAMATIALLCRGARSPADLGLGPDGDLQPAPGAHASGNEVAEDKPTAGELRSINMATALVMAVSLMLAGMGGLAMQSQAPALMESSGLNSQVAATLLGLLAIAATVGQAGIGWLLDRWSVERCTVIVSLSLLIGLGACALIGGARGVTLATLGSVMFGLGLGGTEMMWIALTKYQFGVRLFAYTYGGWSCSIAIGYALGGPVGGWLFDHYPHNMFPILILLLYVPALVTAVWRPAKRNSHD